jgi:predicted TIM-barrel fold metal-dependent hydrolase
MDMIATVGIDRVLFSCDYPYEQLKDAAHWFDELTLDAALKHQVARENAVMLLNLDRAR